MESSGAPAVVTLHLWTVPTRAVAPAVARMAWDRRHLRRTPGLRFAKLLGTGDGRTFTVRDADPRRWGLLACWDDTQAVRRFATGPVARAWQRLADETWRVDLRPLSARGRWAGVEPFGAPTGRHDSTVAAITRARLTARKARTFWRAVPPVSARLHRSPGLRFAVGVGEAPLGLQGTFSLWDTAADLRAFAYDSAEHVDAVRRTTEVGWYREELFARFAVVASEGTVDGVDPAR